MSQPKVRFFDASNLDSIDWPAGYDGDYAREYLTPMLRDGVRKYIKNIDTKMGVLRIDDLVLPITVNEAQWKNSYVCAPYTHYISYAEEELYLIENRVLRLFLRIIIRTLGLFLRAMRINKVVHVNNWLLSTNLYPDLNEAQIGAITVFLRERYPDYAIIFRSVNKYRSDQTFNALKAVGYRSIMSRQIYLLDTTIEKKFRAKPFKQDLKLMRECNYTVHSAEQLTREDCPRIVDLYDALYLDKYSDLNPQFTEEFIDLARTKGILTLKVLKDPNGQVDAVLGYFRRNGMMTTPVFGYDTTISRKVGLYRLISVVLALDAKEQQTLLHQSSGAASFKRLRKAEGAGEYSLVLDAHLSWFRRMPWAFLEFVAAKVGEPIMKKFQL